MVSVILRVAVVILAVQESPGRISSGGLSMAITTLKSLASWLEMALCVAASQSAISSQEAKDFKVVIAMDNPPDEIRPGLSCTAKITTATRKMTLTIPIQALTVRQKGDLEPKKPGTPASGTQPVTKLDPAAEKARKEEVQGVFVVAGGKATFHKVETGITGATDIEVLTGLDEGAQIVTGTYQIIRTIANDAQVKVDNKPAVEAPKS